MAQVARVIAVPAAGGAPVVIRCTQLSTRMTIQEDGAANGGFQQGLIIQLLTPKQFGQFSVGPTQQIPPNLSLEPVLVAGYPGDHPPNTVPIGNGGSGGQPVGPGGPATLGTPIVQVTSAGLATSIDVTEWN